MRVVRSDVGLEGFLCRLIQEVVLCNQFLQLFEKWGKNTYYVIGYLNEKLKQIFFIIENHRKLQN